MNCCNPRGRAIARSGVRGGSSSSRRLLCHHLLLDALNGLGGGGAIGVHLALLLELGHRLQSWPDTRVHHMPPVAFAARRQALEAFHQQNAGIANLALAGLLQLEALNKVRLVALRVREPGTERNDQIPG